MIAVTLNNFNMYRIPTWNRDKYVRHMLKVGQRNKKRFWGLGDKCTSVWKIRNGKVVWCLDWKDGKWQERPRSKGMKVTGPIPHYSELVVDAIVESALGFFAAKNAIFQMFIKLLSNRRVHPERQLVPYGFWNTLQDMVLVHRYKPQGISVEEFLEYARMGVLFTESDSHPLFMSEAAVNLRRRFYDDVEHTMSKYIFGVDPYTYDEDVDLPDEWNHTKNVVEIKHGSSPDSVDGDKFIHRKVTFDDGTEGDLYVMPFPLDLEQDKQPPMTHRMGFIEAVPTDDGTAWKQSKRFSNPENRLGYADLTLEKLDSFMKEIWLQEKAGDLNSFRRFKNEWFDQAVKREADQFLRGDNSKLFEPEPLKGVKEMLEHMTDERIGAKPREEEE